jgi:CBS domain-containing protein
MVETGSLLNSNDDVDRGVEALAESSCDSIVVVDEEGLHFGMFGATESIRAAFPGYLWEITSPEILGRALDPLFLGRGTSPRRIADLADRRPIHVNVGASISNLACLFMRHQVTVVPVLDRGVPSGVVSRQSLLDRVLIPQMRTGQEH